MAKKKQKVVAKTKKPTTTPRTGGPIAAKEKRPEFELIHFDLKVWIFIGACLFFFMLFVGLKWHNSSIARWNQMVPDGGDLRRGLIAGEPVLIRSDEWLVYSSFVLAQEKNGFSTSNEAIGYGKTPVAFGLPTKHIVSAVRPALWGYYLLGIEHGFSWQWNFKIWPFLIASFLLLMLFTKNNFLISIFGSFWLLLSTAVQWWSINTELFTFGCVSVISFIYILFSDKPRLILTSAVFLLLASFSYIVVLYPAYQVPMAYFLIVLILGYLIKNKSFLQARIKNSLPLKLITIGCTLALLFLLVYLFYQETKDTIKVMADTVYPGKRDEKGGDFSFYKLFSDNFSLFMGMTKYPAIWGNICEASSFLMLFPFAFILIIIDFIKNKKTDPLLFSLCILQVILCIWLFFGFPSIIAKMTMFNTSPTYRTFYIFGFANVMLTLLFMAHYKNSFIKNSIVVKAISAVLILAIVYGINYSVNKYTSSFFTSSQVLKSTLLISSLIWLLVHFSTHKFFRYSFISLCLLMLLPNAAINPIGVGLAPFKENGIYKFVSGIEAKDPGQGWMVFGAFTYGNFLKAAGLNCFNGNQCVPPLEKLRILDPEMKSDSIYNRYAHIDARSYIDKDSVKFELIQADRYAIKMDPCSPKLTAMGIKYLLFTYQPQPIEVECMAPVKDTLGIYVYKRYE